MLKFISIAAFSLFMTLPFVVIMYHVCNKSKAAPSPRVNKENRHRPHTSAYSPTDSFCTSPTFEQHVIEITRLKHARWLYQTGRMTEFPDNYEIEA